VIDSHNSIATKSPSPLLALVALGIVARLRPTWVGVELKAAAADEHVSAERVSRLVSRAIEAFQAVLEGLTRRGRPPRDTAGDDRDAELSLTRELLLVASRVIARVSLRRAGVRTMLLGAWQRLSALPLAGKLTQTRFCQALGLSERTLRAWLKSPPAPAPAGTTPVAEVESDPATAPPRPRPPRRRRFDFDFVLPGTQVGADTTDLEAFGVKLKLVAAQDIGGRDQDLFDAVVVDDHESAEAASRVFQHALQDRAGAQAVTDQGTPYMAEALRAALEALGVEHAPQREGDPCGKSTVERAFRSLKDIARPLLSLTSRIAMAMPALCNGDLAKAAARLLITALLRAYQHGARAGRAASDARGGLDPDTIAERVAEAREQARATDTSARLLLAHIHDLYDIGVHRPVRRFVDSLRRYPVAVLHEAERMLQTQCHRDDIRDRASYFAALVRRAFHDHRRERERARYRRDELVRSRDAARNARARHDAFRADPTTWMRAALDMLASQWIGSEGLLFGGVGPALGMLRAALARIVLVHGAAARDLAKGVWLTFAAQRQGLGPGALVAIEALVRREIHAAATLAPTHTIATTDASAILRSTGRFPRPPPSVRLRN